MRISDWSSDVCSSDLTLLFGADSAYGQLTTEAAVQSIGRKDVEAFHARWFHPNNATLVVTGDTDLAEIRPLIEDAFAEWKPGTLPATVTPHSDGPQSSVRSEEHTSDLQSLMRISYAVFCLKTKPITHEI